MGGGGAGFHTQSCALFSFPSVFSFSFSFLPPARPWTRHSGFRNDPVENLCPQKDPRLMREMDCDPIITVLSTVIVIYVF